ATPLPTLRRRTTHAGFDAAVAALASLHNREHAPLIDSTTPGVPHTLPRTRVFACGHVLPVMHREYGQVRRTVNRSAAAKFGGFKGIFGTQIRRPQAQRPLCPPAF